MSIQKNPGQPVAVVGAGDLISHLHRDCDELSPDAYRYSIFRFSHELEVTHGLRPSDLRDLVKLCQVLAFTMTDDGWLSREAHDVVLALFEDLDELTRQWDEANHG